MAAHTFLPFNISFLSLLKDLAFLILISLAYVTLTFLYIVFVKPRFSALRVLRGPKPRSVFWGHVMDLATSDDPGSLHEEWTREYGHVYAFRFLFNVRAFCRFWSLLFCSLGSGAEIGLR